MKELQFTDKAKFEIREEAGKLPVLCGYGIVFNVVADMGNYFEIVRPEAVADDIASEDVQFLYSHDRTRPLASTRNGTLKLVKDEIGVYFEAEINTALSYANDVLENVKTNIIRSMSFGFNAIKDFWGGNAAKPTRELLNIEIGEISPVLLAAYDATTLNIRSKDDIFAEYKQVKIPKTLTDDEKAIKNKLLDLELI